MTAPPDVFRHESFLLVLPFHARLHAGFVLHVKDGPGARRENGWEHFDLQEYLGLDSPETPGAMASTTLMFKLTRGEPVRPWRTAEQAWPDIFRWQRRQQRLHRR